MIPSQKTFPTGLTQAAIVIEVAMLSESSWGTSTYCVPESLSACVEKPPGVSAFNAAPFFKTPSFPLPLRSFVLPSKSQ